MSRHPLFSVQAWITPAGVKPIGVGQYLHHGVGPYNYAELYRVAPPAARFAIATCDQMIGFPETPPSYFVPLNEDEAEAQNSVRFYTIRPGNILVADIYKSELIGTTSDVKPRWVPVDFNSYEHAVAYMTVGYVHDSTMELRTQLNRKELEQRREREFNQGWLQANGKL